MIAKVQEQVANAHGKKAPPGGSHERIMGDLERDDVAIMLQMDERRVRRLVEQGLSLERGGETGEEGKQAPVKEETLAQATTEKKNGGFGIDPVGPLARRPRAAPARTRGRTARTPSTPTHTRTLTRCTRPQEAIEQTKKMYVLYLEVQAKQNELWASLWLVGALRAAQTSWLLANKELKFIKDTSAWARFWKVHATHARHARMHAPPRRPPTFALFAPSPPRPPLSALCRCGSCSWRG